MSSCDCHPTYGAHLRSKNIRVAYCNQGTSGDYTGQKRWDSELAAYRDARAQGIQPAGTQLHQVRQALDLSDKLGRAYDAGQTTGLADVG